MKILKCARAAFKTLKYYLSEYSCFELKLTDITQWDEDDFDFEFLITDNSDNSKAYITINSQGKDDELKIHAYEDTFYDFDEVEMWKILYFNKKEAHP